MRSHKILACMVILCTVMVGLLYSQENSTNSVPTVVDESQLSFSEPTQETTSDNNQNSTSMTSYFIRMIIVLALVIAVIFVFYYFVKKAAKPNTTTNSDLRVLATTNLSTGRSVHIVSVGRKAWLIGSTDNSVSAISQIEDQEIIDSLILKADASPEMPRRNFSTIILDMIKPKANKNNSIASGQKPKLDTSFISDQRERLKKL